MKLVIELIFIAILIICLWSGYKKGLVMTLGSILIIIVSLFVGDLLSDTFSHEPVAVLRPFVAGYMEGVDGAIETSLDEVMGDTSDMLSIEDIIELHPEITHDLCRLSFEKLGVFPTTAEVMATEALELHEQGGYTISSAIVEIMCSKLTYYIGFILFFAITVILLTVLGNLSNISFKIPNMDKLNTIGGAVSGIVVGFLFCAVLAWVLKFAGAILPEETMEGVFTSMFLKFDTLSKYLSI